MGRNTQNSIKVSKFSKLKWVTNTDLQFRFRFSFFDQDKDGTDDFIGADKKTGIYMKTSLGIWLDLRVLKICRTKHGKYYFETKPRSSKPIDCTPHISQLKLHRKVKGLLGSSYETEARCGSALRFGMYSVFERGVRECHFFMLLSCHSNYKNITRIAHSYRARKSALECTLDCDEKFNSASRSSCHSNYKNITRIAHSLQENQRSNDCDGKLNRASRSNTGTPKGCARLASIVAQLQAIVLIKHY